MEKKENKQSKEKKGGKLVHTVRLGAIAANIWERQTQTGFPYYDYSLSRSWKKSEDKHGYSSNFHPQNVEALIHCVEGATKWILDKTADNSQPEDVAFPEQDEADSSVVSQPVA